MIKQITADSSFLINFHLLGWLELLCKIYNKILVTPTVRKECSKIKTSLDTLPCIVYVKLSNREQELVSKLDKEIKAKFPGEHKGEVEALVVAYFRKAQLLISDNFAPWYLREKYKEISVEIERGHYAVMTALENGILIAKNKSEFESILNKLKGVYPRKAINTIKRKFGVR